MDSVDKIGGGDVSHAVDSEQDQLKNGIASQIDNHKQQVEDDVNNEKIVASDDKVEKSDINEPVKEKESLLNVLDKTDKYFSSFIQQMECSQVFEMLLIIPLILYSVIGISILVIAYAFFFESIYYFVNVLCCLIINEMLKRAIKRQRPNPELIANRKFNLNGLPGYLLLKKSKSMPSGDTAQASIFAFTIIYTMDYFNQISQFDGYWIFCVLISIPIVAFERIYFGKHWIGDTICGALEALIICTITYYALGEYLFFDLHDFV